MGNFTFWTGETSAYTRAGLLNADFKEIYPAVYRHISLLDDKGHYLLRGGRGRRGDLFGVGNAQGSIVIDTVLLGFQPTVIETPTGQNSRGQWYIQRDTLPFLVFEDARTGKKGLWHRQYGQLRPPEYDYIGGLNPTTFFQEKGDTSYLLHTDGQVMAGPFYRVRTSRDNRYFIARPNWNDAYILLDLEGRFIRNLESEPRLLAEGVYLLHRYVKAPNSYAEVKRFALFDRDFKPITEFIFEAEPMPMDRLQLAQRILLLEVEQPTGYGPWVGWMQKSAGEPMVLLDEQGKEFELK
ncbi:MAG: hypothetical protein IPK76_15385 [Lewinellaceae bacterium]|nr:hypothetical protein [Lewinellaceae bacterium]